MKRQLIFSFLFFFSGSIAFAGSPLSRSGIKAGLNLSSFNGSDVEGLDLQLKPDLHAGFFICAGINNFFAIQPEFLLSIRGANYDGNDNRSNLWYGEVPLLFKFELKQHFYATVGPQVSYLLAASETNGGETEDVPEFDERYETLEFAYSLGIGYEMKDGGLVTGVRYNQGLTSIYNEDHLLYGDSDVKNTTIQIFVGIGF